MDQKIEIKEEPVWLEDTACSSFEHVELESAVAELKEETKPELTEPAQPATDVKEEITVDEHITDHLVPHIIQENSAEHVAVLIGAAVDTGDSSCKVLGAGSELTCTLLPDSSSNQQLLSQSSGEPIRPNEGGKAFSSKSILRTHTLIHSRERSNYCNKCGKMFIVKNTLKTHNLRPVKCADCCDECCNEFCRKSNHEREVLAGNRLYSCMECGKTFGLESCFTDHLLIHCAERARCCPECGKIFNAKGALTQHQRTHSGERPHRCPECGKTFRAKGAVTQHVLTHIEERSHHCNECHKTFRWKAGLTEHLLIHSGERPHRCLECGKTFRRKNALTKHVLTHSGERPHFCKECGRAFSVKHSLTRHLLTHSAECHTIV